MARTWTITTGPVEGWLGNERWYWEAEEEPPTHSDPHNFGTNNSRLKSSEYTDTEVAAVKAAEAAIEKELRWRRLTTVTHYVPEVD